MLNKFLLAIILLLAVSGQSWGSIIFINGTYSQDFNSLASTGTPAWTDNSTIAGWFSSTTSYLPSTGAQNNNTLYSYGTTSEDRALGSTAANFGVRFVNNSSTTFTSFTVSFTGEQWRKADNATVQSLTAGYAIGSPTLTLASAFTSASNLSFNSPVANASAATALNGNLSANRTAVSATITGINWAPSEQLFIRWLNPNDSGTDHGLAIDDFSFTATAVPEPTSMILVGLVGVAGIAGRARRLLSKKA